MKAEVAVDAVFEAMVASMMRGERIELRGFGVFQVKPRKRGIGRNPRTGKEVRIPPGRTIRFKPGKELQNLGGKSLPFDRARFQKPYGRSFSTAIGCTSLLFLLTLFTTTVLHVAFGGSVWYSIPILTILGAHEFGHYFYCRSYGVDASLPYFLPAPFPLTGTLGAVIRIREAFPSKAALFDIAVAGPIAGFVALLPFLYISFRYQTTAADHARQPPIVFGEPLLFKLVSLRLVRPAAGGL